MEFRVIASSYATSRVQYVHEHCILRNVDINDFKKLFIDQFSDIVVTKDMPLQESEYMWQLSLQPNLETPKFITFSLKPKEGAQLFVDVILAVRVEDAEVKCATKEKIKVECKTPSCFQDVWKLSIEKIGCMMNSETYKTDTKITIKIETVYAMNYATWSVQTAKLKADDNQNWSDPATSDLLIITHDMEFPVHRDLLKKCSPVFHAMFSDEGYVEHYTNRLGIQDFEVLTVQLLIQFMYRNWIEFPQDFDAVMKVLQAADYYLIYNLKMQCTSHIAQSLKRSNVCEILLNADHFGFDELKCSAIDFIFEHVYMRRGFPNIQLELDKTNSALLKEFFDYCFEKCEND